MSRRRQYTPLQRKRIGYLMQPQFFLETEYVSYFNAFLVLVFLNEDSSNTLINHSISIFISLG